MLIIFDCDGVLVDSEIIAARVDAEYLEEAGYPITVEELTERFAGHTGARIFEIVEEEMGRALPDKLKADAEAEIDRRLAAEVQAIAGAAELLDRIDAPYCICSNSSVARLKISLTKVGLWDRFHPHIFSSVDLPDTRPKPAPDVFLHAAKAFDTEPMEVVVIEDSIAGVTGAKAAGMRVVGFTGASHSWTGHADALTNAGADTVIRRLADLPAVVRALAEWDGDM